MQAHKASITGRSEYLIGRIRLRKNSELTTGVKSQHPAQSHRRTPANEQRFSTQGLNCSVCLRSRRSDHVPRSKKWPGLCTLARENSSSGTTALPGEAPVGCAAGAAAGADIGSSARPVARRPAYRRRPRLPSPRHGRKGTGQKRPPLCTEHWLVGKLTYSAAGVSRHYISSFPSRRARSLGRAGEEGGTKGEGPG